MLSFVLSGLIWRFFPWKGNKIIRTLGSWWTCLLSKSGGDNIIWLGIQSLGNSKTLCNIQGSGTRFHLVDQPLTVGTSSWMKMVGWSAVRISQIGRKAFLQSIDEIMWNWPSNTKAGRSFRYKVSGVEALWLAKASTKSASSAIGLLLGY